MGTPRTLFDKIWDSHLVNVQDDGTCLIYIDRHLIHEVTSPQAFEGGAATAARRSGCRGCAVGSRVASNNGAFRFGARCSSAGPMWHDQSSSHDGGHS